MKSRLGVVLLLLLLGVGWLAFSRGWLTVSRQPHDGKLDVTVTVDREKAEADAERAREKARDLKNQAAENTQELRDRIKNP